MKGKEQKSIFQYLLNLQSSSSDEISQFCSQQSNAILRSILKVELSKHIKDPNLALNQLKHAHNFVFNYSRTTINEESLTLYKQTLILIFSRMITTYMGLQKYKQAIQTLEQTLQMIKTIQNLRQMLFNMFGFSSLAALQSYSLSSSDEIKYPLQSQISMLFLVGQVKMVAYDYKGAQNVFERILSSLKIPSHNSSHLKCLINQVNQYLHHIDPNKYKSAQTKDLLRTKQQKQSFHKIIRKLLQKQKQLSVFRQPVKRQVVISKRLFWLFLNQILRANTLRPSRREPSQAESVQLFNTRFRLSIRYQTLELTEDYVSSLLKNLQKETNSKVINEILSNTKLVNEAQNYYQQKLSLMNKVFLRPIFRLLLSVPLLQKSQQSQVSNIPIKTSSVQKSKVNKKKVQPKSFDITRAEQILKSCLSGNFLIKINFGNSSTSRRFAKIDEKGFFWGQNQKMVKQLSSFCKWKHVYGITYGRVSPNLAKKKFDNLVPWRCFSIISTDRSFDFQCEGDTDVFFWLQAISYQLQKFYGKPQLYPYYSKGRALWKMMLLKMEKKGKKLTKIFSCRNAGIVIKVKHLIDQQKKSN